MSEDTDRLGVVVVSYGSSYLLEQNLASLDLSKVEPVSVAVVDNWTTPAERARVESLAAVHGWELLTPAANLGFGRAVDLGVERLLAVGCAWVLILNPDVQLDVGALASLRDAASEHPGAYSPRIVRPDGSLWFAGGQLDLRRGLTTTRPDLEQRHPDRWLTGACLLVDAGTWRAVGGFHPGYFLYWEDVDLSRRILRAGAALRVVHELQVTHAVGGTQSGEGKSATYTRYMCRNRLLFARLHLPPSGRLRWALSSPRYALRVLQRDGRRAALRRPDRLVAAVAGTLEGLWLLIRPGGGSSPTA